jgi:hypothetical protein
MPGFVGSANTLARASQRGAQRAVVYGRRVASATSPVIACHGGNLRVGRGSPWEEITTAPTNFGKFSHEAVQQVQAAKNRRYAPCGRGGRPSRAYPQWHLAGRPHGAMTGGLGISLNAGAESVAHNCAKSRCVASVLRTAERRRRRSPITSYRTKAIGTPFGSGSYRASASPVTIARRNSPIVRSILTRMVGRFPAKVLPVHQQKRFSILAFIVPVGDRDEVGGGPIILPGQPHGIWPTSPQPGQARLVSRAGRQVQVNKTLFGLSE